MIDKCKRIVRELVPLEQVPMLQGKAIHFQSIAEMVATRAREIPGTPMVYYYDEVITYAQVNQRANRVAHFLKANRVAKGDIVSTMVLNAPEIYYTMFGAQKLGAVAGAINYMLKGPEIAYVLDDSKPKVVFVGSDYMADVAAGLVLARHKPTVVEVVTEAKHQTDIAAYTLDEILAGHPDDECLVPQSLDDPTMLLYSSGTTGMPKGILISSRNELCICHGKTVLGVSRPGDVMMIILPMFHTNPLCVWTYPSIYACLSLCIRKNFSPADFWPAIIRYGATTVQGVPAMYDYIYQAADPAVIDRDRLKLRLAYTGAAPMPAPLIQAFKEKFGVELIDGYGLTEATGVSPQAPPSPG